MPDLKVGEHGEAMAFGAMDMPRWNATSPTCIPVAKSPSTAPQDPFDVTPPVRDVGVALLVSVERNDLAPRTEPDLELPAPEPEQLDPGATLEPDDHSALPRYFAPLSMPEMTSFWSSCLMLLR